MAQRRKSLRGYEGGNLLFFLAVIVVLGVFVSFVFQYYRTADDRPPGTGEKGILSEAVVPGADTCIYYMGTRLSPSNRRYLGPHEIPPTDDGFIKQLFEIPGVLEVVVDQTRILLRKSYPAGWENIQSRARDVILNHLHMHP